MDNQDIKGGKFFAVDDELNADWIKMIKRIRMARGAKDMEDNLRIDLNAKIVHREKGAIIERLKKKFDDLGNDFRALIGWTDTSSKNTDEIQELILATEKAIGQSLKEGQWVTLEGGQTIMIGGPKQGGGVSTGTVGQGAGAGSSQQAALLSREPSEASPGDWMQQVSPDTPMGYDQIQPSYEGNLGTWHVEPEGYETQYRLETTAPDGNMITATVTESWNPDLATGMDWYGSVGDSDTYAQHYVTRNEVHQNPVSAIAQVERFIKSTYGVRNVKSTEVDMYKVKEGQWVTLEDGRTIMIGGPKQGAGVGGAVAGGGGMQAESPEPTWRQTPTRSGVASSDIAELSGPAGNAKGVFKQGFSTNPSLSSHVQAEVYLNGNTVASGRLYVRRPGTERANADGRQDFQRTSGERRSDTMAWRRARDTLRSWTSEAVSLAASGEVNLIQPVSSLVNKNTSTTDPLGRKPSGWGKSLETKEGQWVTLEDGRTIMIGGPGQGAGGSASAGGGGGAGGGVGAQLALVSSGATEFDNEATEDWVKDELASQLTAEDIRNAGPFKIVGYADEDFYEPLRAHEYADMSKEEWYDFDRYEGPNATIEKGATPTIHVNTEYPAEDAAKLIRSLGKGGKSFNTAFAFKAQDGTDWWLQFTTNAFRDREKELFTTQSLQDYVDRNRGKEIKGQFWYRHIPGTKFGDVRWQAMIGRFLVQAGPFDETPTGQAFKEFFKKYPQGHPVIAPKGWGTSHGYNYNLLDRMDGVYNWLDIKESTVLPAHIAANPWSPMPVIVKRSKEMNEQERKELQTIGGQDLVQMVVARAEDATKDLEQTVDFKADGMAQAKAAVEALADSDIKKALMSAIDSYADMEEEGDEKQVEAPVQGPEPEAPLSRKEISDAIKAGMDILRQEILEASKGTAQAVEESITEAMKPLISTVKDIKKGDDEKIAEKAMGTPAASLRDMVQSAVDAKATEIKDGDRLLKQKPTEVKPITQGAQRFPPFIQTMISQDAQ